MHGHCSDRLFAEFHAQIPANDASWEFPTGFSLTILPCVF